MWDACNCELDFSRGEGLRNARESIWLGLGLQLLGDAKAIERLGKLPAATQRPALGE